MKEALKLARELMNRNGLGHLPLEVSRTKQALGDCWFQRNRLTGEVTPTRIRLSSHWMPKISDAEVRDTILHEIAHALTPGARHGPAWKAMCRRIGANPNRTADLPPETVMVVRKATSNYRAVCTKCDNVHYFSRYTKNWRLGRYKCGKCKSDFKVFSQ